jgi:prepilin-type processing-associated H-X9-DG protein
MSEYKAPAQTLFIADSSLWAIGYSDNVGYQDIYCPIGTHPEAGLHDCFRDTCSSNHGTVIPPAGWVTKRHHGGANCVFMDGHAKWFKYERLRDSNPANDIWGHTTTPPGGDAWRC